MATNAQDRPAQALAPALRKAEDFRFEMPHQPGQAHRSAAGWMIDYKLQELTGGQARAISTVAGQFADKPAFKSPWHYHDCALQVAIVLEGSIELGYRADSYARAGKGDVLFIPGEVPHDVSAPSADYVVAEITFPGSFGTTEAEMPPPGAETCARTLGTQDAVRSGEQDGIIDYVYPIGGGLHDRYAIHRLLRSRVSPFAPGTRRHDDAFRMAIAISGWREVDLGSGVERTGPGDLLVIPGGADWRDVAMSDDYDAVEVRMLSA
jgi:quercetin dioxygenase-like cupin family protein